MATTAAINVIQTSFQSTGATSHTVAVATGYNIGNMGVIGVLFTPTSSGVHPGTISIPNGWTLFGSKVLTGSGANYAEVYYYIKQQLAANETSVVFATTNAVISASVYFDVSGIKNVPSAFVSLGSAGASAMSSASTAAQTIMTNATEVLVIDVLSVLAGVSVASQSTANWTTNSSSTVWSIATQTVTTIAAYTGPTWSWVDATHRYAALRLALPTVNGNIQPIAKIGSGYSLFVLPGQQLNLSSASLDLDGMVSTYQWTNMSSYDTGLPVLTNASSATCSVVIPIEPNRVYQIGLTVTDNNGLASLPTSIGLIVQDAVNARYVRIGGVWRLSPSYVRKNGQWH